MKLTKDSPVITKNSQKTASYILTKFMYICDMEDFLSVWNDIFDTFNLCIDPFNHLPCTPDEYSKNSLDYSKHLMVEFHDRISNN